MSRKRKNSIFSADKKKNTSFKYFIVAFGVFLLILTAVSVLLFMKSIDFDFKNLAGVTESTDNSSTTEPQSVYSVEALENAGTVLFYVTDGEGKPDWAVALITDFNSKAMQVKGFSAPEALGAGGSFTDFKNSVSATIGTPVDKYAVFTYEGLVEFFSQFDGITVNVPVGINYQGADFTLKLDAGRQALSPEYTAKLLSVSNDSQLAGVMCDVINSVLAPEYTENSQKLFTEFVNLSNTDISVIDYSEWAEALKIYSNSTDKFYPTVK